MSLIIILTCLALQRFANIGGWFENAWFETYLTWLRAPLAKVNLWGKLAVVILPVFIVLTLLHFLLIWRLFGLFYFILSTVVLFFCMDARNLKNELATYFANAKKQDLQAAKEALEKFKDTLLLPSVTKLTKDEVHRAVTKMIFLQASQQIFSILFWFIVLGIYGASGYFLITLLRKNALKVNEHYSELAHLAAQIQDLLDWLPTRLTSLTFALVGHFSKGFAYFYKHMNAPLKDNQTFVINSGFAALDIDIKEEDKVEVSENQAALDLVDRTLIAWIVAVALISFGMLL
jgi:membrane protein required for beta-lactamase induction